MYGVQANTKLVMSNFLSMPFDTTRTQKRPAPTASSESSDYIVGLKGR